MLVGLLFAEFRHHCKALVCWLFNIFLKLTLCYENCFYPMGQLSNSANSYQS